MTNNNNKPVYCRECRTQNSFELCPARDITTESGQSFMLGWKCEECGKVVIMTNPDYQIKIKKGVRYNVGRTGIS